MNETKIKISVIVPAYNAQNYIGRCIDSIIEQTYQNWSLIAVDDGSTDNTFSILKEYEKKDSRISVFHQLNKGAGIARNTGIKQADGYYIVFVDSDDVINKNYFELLSKKREDVVFINIDQVNEKYKIIKREHLSKYRGLSKDAFIRDQMTGKIPWGGVEKLSKENCY